MQFVQLSGVTAGIHPAILYELETSAFTIYTIYISPTVLSRGHSVNATVMVGLTEHMNFLFRMMGVVASIFYSYKD